MRFNGFQQIKNIARYLYHKWIDAQGKRYYSALKKRLQNPDPCIITNNCSGGIIYHNLGLRFNSPTINLAINDNDYILFCENLFGFLSVTPVDGGVNRQGDPVGLLRYNNLEIKITFTHYKNFEHGCEKWQERKKRINPDNLYVIWFLKSTNITNTEFIDRFLKLPFEHKIVVFGGKRTRKEKSKIIIRDFNLTSKNRLFIFRKGLLAYKRYLDKFDYVEFLNQGVSSK